MINDLVEESKNCIRAQDGARSLHEMSQVSSNLGKKNFAIIKDESKESYQLRQYSSKLALLWDKLLRVLNVRKGTLLVGESGMKYMCDRITVVFSSLLNSSYGNGAALQTMKTASVGLRWLSSMVPDKSFEILGIVKEMEGIIRNMEAIVLLKEPKVSENLVNFYDPIFNLTDFKENPVENLQTLIKSPVGIQILEERCGQYIKKNEEAEQQTIQLISELDALNRQVSDRTNRLENLRKVKEQDVESLIGISTSIETYRSEIKKIEGSKRVYEEEMKPLVKLMELEERFDELNQKNEELVLSYTQKNAKEIEKEIELLKTDLEETGLLKDEFEKIVKENGLREKQYSSMPQYWKYIDDQKRLEEDLKGCEGIKTAKESRIEQNIIEIHFQEEELDKIKGDIQKNRQMLESLEHEIKTRNESALTIEDLKVQQGNLQSLGQGGEKLEEGTIAQIILAMSKKEPFSDELKLQMANNG